ncbi:hypothetical protein CYMTET_14371, partial [Cymbomonas tetramitiformis]
MADVYRMWRQMLDLCGRVTHVWQGYTRGLASVKGPNTVDLGSGTGELVYVDFGMVAEVKHSDRLGLMRIVVNFVNRDATALASDFVSLSFLPLDTDIQNAVPTHTLLYIPLPPPLRRPRQPLYAA